MAIVDIKYLFYESRLPHGIYFALFVLYCPFGLLLAILRLFIGFHAYLVACFLPKLNFVRSIVLRVMCAVLGVIVTTNNRDKRDPNVKVMITNYTSTLDHLAVDIAYPSILPCVWDLPPTLMWLLGYVDMGVKDGREKLIANAKKHCSESDVPLLVFPEGASTNGKKGLLKFSLWPFSLDQPVQPVIINISRPFIADISPSILGGRWWNDVFWFLFVPYTSFKITILPVERLREGESIKEFAKRVQVSMARALGIHATSHTSSDKVEYAKRQLIVPPVRPQPQQSNGSEGSPETELQIKVRQVQEVLPDVSPQVIARSLAMTKDVDLTISNLLEGNMTSFPDETRDIPSTNVQLKKEPAKSSTAAKTFSRHVNARQMSLKERKEALLEYARQKYIEKHKLKL